MKTPKVKFSYNYAKGSQLCRTVKASALSENFFHELLDLYCNKNKVPLSEITAKFKQLMPETIYFNLKKLPESEWDTHGACMTSYTNKDGKISRYTISVPLEGDSLEIEDLPELMHETTHLFDSLLQPKTLKTIEKVYANERCKKIDDFFYTYYYCGNEDLMAKNRSNSNVYRMTRKFLKQFSVKDKLIILNYYKETMNTELNAVKIQDLCNEKLENRVSKDNFWSFEEMDNLYHYEDRIKLLNKMIKEILLKERYKMTLKKANSPMDKLKLTFNYCLNSLM